MKKSLATLLAIGLFVLVPVQVAWSHCQVPCGIYGDETRFDLLEEHITTIEKSMKEILSLSADAQNNVNQLVRWVNNKEVHADEFTEIVTYYFLAQRIKSDAPDYEKKLVLLHGLMVSAMKCKQTTDQQNIADMRESLSKFKALYMDKAAAAHLKEHHDGEHEETAAANTSDSATAETGALAAAIASPRAIR